MLDVLSNFLSSQDALTTTGLLLFLFFATFVSEDAACLLAGSAVASGRLSFVLATVACLFGIFAGDLMLYTSGRLIGSSIFQHRFVRQFVSVENQTRARQWLDKNAVTAVFTSRFVSGLRLPTYLLAGTFKTDAVKFTVFFALAAAIWTPILVGATAFSASLVFNWHSAVLPVLLLIFFRQIIKYSHWKNRRLLVGRMKRFLNWEFWPLAIFYTPVVFYILLLGLRYRSLTLFTAANPAMPASGFVGESKSDIYKLLSSSPNAATHLLKFVKIDASQSFLGRLVTAITFINKNELEFPLVLKPDVGERGKSVKIIRDKKHLGLALRAANQNVILQEFAEGVEASVFYYRLPGTDRGNILSITEKVFPVILGDGQTTIERLILKDELAVCLAASYFENLSGRLNEVPKNGEKVQLIEIGTHSKGAIFKEGGWMITEELDNAVDTLCRAINGCYFGRFDVRAGSFEDLMSGRFKIIELNGVTSESTNIYDPRYSLVDAYRILFRQWKLAFLIGKANRSRGVAPLALRQFITLLATRDTSFLVPKNGNDKVLNVTSRNICA
jgi:membrane protein DedA with SNARE-associated domain